MFYAFKQKSDKASPRQLQQLDFVGQFTTDIVHIAGENNIVADALSRISTLSTMDDMSLPADVTPEELASEKQKAAELQKLL